MRRISKPWGYELVWAETDRYVGKVLAIRAGERLSLQFHRVKDESILVAKGLMDLEVEEAGRMITRLSDSRSSRGAMSPSSTCCSMCAEKR
jgi:hypothetical protein